MPLEFPFNWQGRTMFEAFQRDEETGKAKGIVRLDLSSIAPGQLTLIAEAKTEGKAEANNG